MALSAAPTIERVDEALMMAGFENKIPINREVFAGGDGNSVEDAPIGYYRFHFWKSDEQWKDHENWISNTDLAGPICVSLLKEEQALGKRTFYRMLFRSLFSTKSIVLCQDDVSDQFFDTKKLTRHQILGIGLRELIGHEMDKMAALEDEFGAMSIRSSCSIVSFSNDLVRSLPSSRLREASVPSSIESCSSECGALSRSMSVRSTTKSPIDSPASPNPTVASPEKSGALRRRFRDLCSVNVMELVKSFTQVKDGEFYQVLLHLERALNPQVCHFDVVIATAGEEEDGDPGTINEDHLENEAVRRQRESSWNSFTKMLGIHLTKIAFQEQSLFLAKQGRVPSDVMSELILEQRRQHQQRTRLADDARPAPEESSALTLRRNNLLTDFVLNEISYIKKLQLIDEYFIGPMNPVQGDGSDPMGVRGLIHAEDYKFIFEGFPEVIKLHLRMISRLVRDEAIEGNSIPDRDHVLRLVEEGIITGKAIAEVLLETCKDKGFTIYASICDDFHERCQLLKRLCDGSPRLQEYVEHVASDPRSNRLVIDQVMGSIFQMITRYSLQLKAIIGATVVGDECIPLLEMAISRLDDTVTYIEHFKKRRDDTTSLFQIQRTIQNCPPNLCQLQRIFLMKMAAYEVVKGEVDFNKRLTLFLFNDIVIGAKKRKAKEGKLSEMILGGSGALGTVSPSSDGRKTRSHDFMFLCRISEVSLKRLDVKVKARRNQVKAFSLDIPPDALVWSHDRQVVLQEVAESHPSSYLLVPKKQEKLHNFIEKLNDCKHQKYLADSPADIFVRQGEDGDLYFHVYKGNQYRQWQHHNRIAILYCDHAPMPDLWELFPEGQCDALMIVQVLNGAFRFAIRSREMIVASSDCFGANREFQIPEQLMRRFTTALVNCHLIHSIYPPFGPQIELKMRQQLEQHMEPFSRGVFRKFKELANRLQKTSETKSDPYSDDSPSSLYSVENNHIAEDDLGIPGSHDDAPALKKRSVFGKVLGKLKSPLSK